MEAKWPRWQSGVGMPPMQQALDWLSARRNNQNMDWVREHPL